jgi:ribosomal protein S18 acetylase RimI-like enzyme
MSGSAMPTTCQGEIHLRRAAEADAAAIATIHVRSWQRAYRGILPGSFLEGLRVQDREEGWRRIMTTLAADRHPWLAEAGGDVAGFVSAGPSRDDDAGRQTGEVYAIYVDPDCWARGIGRALFSHAIHDLRDHGYDTATLWVLMDNRQARDFYEAAGWQADGAERSDSIGGQACEEVRYRIELR